MKRWRPRVIRICVFLLLGAIVNVAVAWGCALRAPISTDLRMFAPTEYENLFWHRYVETETGATIASRSHARGISYLQVSGALAPNSLTISDANEDGAARTFTSQAWPNTVFANVVAAIDGGWPCRSLRAVRREPRLAPGEQPGGKRHVMNFSRGAMLDDCWLQRPPSDTVRIFAAVPIATTSGGQQEFRMLPLQPLWPGFATNTLFYAAILWTLFAVPFALRRRRRIKRGLCPKCGYNLRGAPSDSIACPECGTTAKTLNVA